MHNPKTKLVSTHEYENPCDKNWWAPRVNDINQLPRRDFLNLKDGQRAGVPRSRPNLVGPTGATGVGIMEEMHPAGLMAPYG